VASVSVDLDTASSAELIRAQREIAAALAVRSAPIAAAECVEQVAEIGRIADILEAAIAVRVEPVDAAGEVRGCGYSSTVSWLRACLGTRHGRAAERVAVAQQLPRITRTYRRLAAGELGYGYVAAIAEGVKRLDDRDAAEAEQILLALADDGGTVKDLDRTAARIIDAIADRDDGDSRSRNRRRGYRRSWLQVSPDIHGRGARVAGWLSAEHASMLRQACAPLAQPAGADDPRDRAQRFADALYSRLSRGGTQWNATLVIDLDTLCSSFDQGGSSSRPARSGPSNRPSHSGPSDQRGVSSSSLKLLLADARRAPRTVDGFHIDRAQARRIALNSGISTLLLGPAGVPLYLGRKVRVVSTAQRKVIAALYETCAVDVCDIPVHMCEIDHVLAWSQRGPTDIDNLAPLCSYHNKYKEDHPERIKVVSTADSRWRYRLARNCFNHEYERDGNTRAA
jgi:Domain of unknown function (DUF222)/HNH endonuclease